jgi:hypothetical protein
MAIVDSMVTVKLPMPKGDGASWLHTASLCNLHDMLPTHLSCLSDFDSYLVPFGVTISLAVAFPGTSALFMAGEHLELAWLDCRVSLAGWVQDAWVCQGRAGGKERLLPHVRLSSLGCGWDVQKP